jgi:hypothetical protein
MFWAFQPLPFLSVLLKAGSAGTDLNRFSSLRYHDTEIEYDGYPPQGLLRGTAGREVFLIF